MPTLVEFLTLLFSDVPPGYIEIRIIEEKKGGKVVERRWFESARHLLDALDDLNRIATTRGAAVFFGVLARKAIGVGKAHDVLPGFAYWTDLDFQDFEGGEVEARRILNAFPLLASIVVRSGHGLHCYWLFREPVDPLTIVNLSKRLALALGGDHAFDAARVLRLPETRNRKEATSPILVEIERLDPERRHNPSDFDADLPPIEDGKQEKREKANDDIRIGDRITPMVLLILNEDRQVRALFHGYGKVVVGEGGRQQDTSSSGYDYSLVLALAKKGILDESELATVLWFRPDGGARSKGVAYISRTVKEALGFLTSTRARAEKSAGVPIDFTAVRVRVFDSDPPLCELTVDGVPIVMSSKELLSLSQVRERIFNALHRVPQLPKTDAWHETVNRMMERAEFVAQPPEASPAGLLREEILRVVENLGVGEEVADLDRERAVLHEGRKAFKAQTLLRRLRDQFPDLKTQDLCAELRRLGFTSGTIRVAGVSVRAWVQSTPGATAGEGTMT
jgi:hypothetical protein